MKVTQISEPEIDLWSLNKSELLAIASDRIGTVDPAIPREVLIQDMEMGTLEITKDLPLDPRVFASYVSCTVPYEEKPDCAKCSPLMWVICTENLNLTKLKQKGGDMEKVQITAQLQKALEDKASDGTILRLTYKILQKAGIKATIGEIQRIQTTVKQKQLPPKEAKDALLKALQDAFELPSVEPVETKVPLDLGSEEQDAEVEVFNDKPDTEEPKEVAVTDTIAVQDKADIVVHAEDHALQEIAKQLETLNETMKAILAVLGSATPFRNKN